MSLTSIPPGQRLSYGAFAARPGAGEAPGAAAASDGSILAQQVKALLHLDDPREALA